MTSEKGRKFGIVPVVDGAMTAFDWAVWAALATFADWKTTEGGRLEQTPGTCYPSVFKLAIRAHMSVRSVRNALRRLEALGYVRTVARWDTTGGQTSSYYVLFPVPLVDETLPMFPEMKEDTPQ